MGAKRIGIGWRDDSSAKTPPSLFYRAVLNGGLSDQKSRSHNLKVYFLING
jgi:hypothetical protein